MDMQKRISVQQLIDEIDRWLKDKRFIDNDVAIEALEAVKWWAIDEAIDNVIKP